MGRYKGRSSVACFTCHGLKVKCSGEIPCQRCRARGRDCAYPVKERLLAIPESYLRNLERNAEHSRRNEPDSKSDASRRSRLQARDTSSPTTLPEHDPLLEDCSAEGFVQNLRKVSLRSPNDLLADGTEQLLPTSPTSTRHTYSKLNFDFIYPEVSFKLPPRPYAFHLLQIFEEGFCDYHWYLRKRFQDRLSLTYSNPSSQANDRNWLCIVSVVLALAESWNHSRSMGNIWSDKSIDFWNQLSPATADGVYNKRLAASDTSSPVPPGAELFEQALLLLKMTLEEPVIEYVQALNLIAFYCYSLNRRRTAYFYAGQSIRLAKLLRLDEALPLDSRSSNEGHIEAEHRKRIWWTSYCMDKMVSTELGLTISDDESSQRLQLPMSGGLSPDDIEEFFNPHLLAAQVQLCSIKSKVIESVTNHPLVGDSVWPVNIIRPCLDRLQDWRSQLPDHMSFSFGEGIPSRMLELPFARVLASLYLRYHQCFILLLRPLFLRDLSSRPSTGMEDQSQAVSEKTAVVAAHESTLHLKLDCLQAARFNAKILKDLRRIGKIAKYGYWESLHLFSALVILCLSHVVIDLGIDHQSLSSSGPWSPVSALSKEPNTASRDISDKGEEDSKLYMEARGLLDDMVQAGNPASKDHRDLLSDVEDMVNRVKQYQRSKVSLPQEIEISAEFSSGPAFGFDGILDEQIWFDMDWDNILRGWTEGSSATE